MARQVVLGEIGVELRLRPVGKRIDLEPALILLEPRQRGAGPRLEPLAPRNPGVERLQRAGKRFDLADLAAAVGVP